MARATSGTSKGRQAASKQLPDHAVEAVPLCRHADFPLRLSPPTLGYLAAIQVVIRQRDTERREIDGHPRW